MVICDDGGIPDEGQLKKRENIYIIFLKNVVHLPNLTPLSCDEADKPKNK